MVEIRNVKTVRELLSGDISKNRPNVLHEGHGLISLDYYNNEDDGSNDVKNIVLTLQYQATYETSADKQRVGKIEAELETIINAVYTLDTI